MYISMVAPSSSLYMKVGTTSRLVHLPGFYIDHMNHLYPVQTNRGPLESLPKLLDMMMVMVVVEKMGKMVFAIFIQLSFLND